MLLDTGMLTIKLPPTRLIAKFVGTAGELRQRCHEVLAQTLPVTHDTTETHFEVVMQKV